MRTKRSSLVVLSAVALVACSDGTSPTPTQDDQTLEEVLTELNTVGTYAGAGLAPAGVATSSMPAPGAGACPFDAGSTYFVCAPVTVNGLTIDRRYQLLDDDGAPLSSFDPATVSGIRNVVDVAGTTSGGQGGPPAITIDLHDDQTLTGLRTATRVVNGSGTTDLTFTNNGEVMTFTTTRTVSNLVLPTVPGPGAYPTSGSITTTGTSALMTYTSTMTFNGTSTVTIVNTINGQSQTCTYNLQTPATPPVCA
ncbi:MAG TPA: hypothetical protein VLE53_07370 [Gemmatimonadaceae bacterium]|nr:hypothetical protein [Gemmatimonadaceae bacterium]